MKEGVGGAFRHEIGLKVKVLLNLFTSNIGIVRSGRLPCAGIDPDCVHGWNSAD